MSRKDLLKRIGQILIILVGISFITFCITYMAPGDPVTAMYSSTGTIPDESILEQTRESLGLNEPFWVQYVNWLSDCLHGDLGTSFSYSKPVAELLAERIVPTIKLALSSLLLMIVVSVPLGILSATHRNGVIDYIVRALSFIGVSMPNFWVGLLLLYIFGVVLQIFPVVSNGSSFVQLVLPTITLAFVMTAKYTRQIRAQFLEEMSQDYVVGARCRGLSERTILWRHVLPNTVLPLLTILGLSFGSLLGGTAVVEVIFSYPGLGNLAISAVTAMDYPLIQGYILWIALIYMVINLVVDIVCNCLDPRLRKAVA